jgi:hypothetical protein
VRPSLMSVEISRIYGIGFSDVWRVARSRLVGKVQPLALTFLGFSCMAFSLLLAPLFGGGKKIGFLRFTHGHPRFQQWVPRRGKRS